MYRKDITCRGENRIVPGKTCKILAILNSEMLKTYIAGNCGSSSWARAFSEAVLFDDISGVVRYSNNYASDRLEVLRPQLIIGMIYISSASRNDQIV